MRNILLSIIFSGGLLWLSGCENQPDAIANTDTQWGAPPMLSPTERWYSTAQIENGEPLFQENCASCHKSDASGTLNWRKTDSNGRYPPPPLNGTAHTWHHSLSVLHRTVRVGGIPLGGTMPGFGGKLSDRQIYDILAWVQSHWSDETYRVWYERNIQSGGHYSRPSNAVMVNKGDKS